MERRFGKMIKSTRINFQPNNSIREKEPWHAVAQNSESLPKLASKQKKKDLEAPVKKKCSTPKKDSGESMETSLNSHRGQS